MAKIIHVVPLDDGRWAVTYKGDPTPLAAFEAKPDAITEAHNHAREFGGEQVVIYDREGNIVDGELVEPEFDAPRGL
jgi:hypothetical protein